MSELLEQRISHIENDVGEIKSTVKQLSTTFDRLSTTVGRIETKIDEREKAIKDKFEDQGKRIDRLGFRFWALVVVIIGGLLSLVHKAYF